MRHTFSSRFLAAILATSALTVAPCAQAAIAIVAGTGTGGTLGSGSTAVSGNTVALTTTVDVPIGDTVHVGVMFRTTSGILSCTDNAATPNTYTPDQAATTSPSISVRAFRSNITSDLANGDTITCTVGATGTNTRAAQAVAFSGEAASSFDSAGSAAPASGSYTSPSTTPPTNTTGTLSQNCASCEVLVPVFGFLATATVTEDTTHGFTSLGTTTDLASVHMAYKIVSSNAATTYAPALSASSAWSVFLQGFQEASGTATGNTPESMTGWGQ